MSSKIEKFMNDRYGAYFLPLATEKDIPGMLLETDWGFWGGVTFKHAEGYSWDYLKLSADDFTSSLVNAKLIQESINDKMDIGGNISLPQYGLNSTSSLESDYQMQIKVTGISARTFDKSTSSYELMDGLLKLKKENESLWDWVNDDFLIVESFYVTSFTAQFKGATDLKIKADFENAGQKIDEGVDYNWKSESTIEVSGAPKAPLAVRGIKV